MNTNLTQASKINVYGSRSKDPLRGTSILDPPSSIVALLLLLATTSSALATVRYVNVNNASPTPPYTNWATAAWDIQSAVDAAGAGDEIVVTNGTYTGGSWADPYGEANCVVVDKPLTLQSVNGPSVTVVDGGGRVRCVYLTNNTVMVGFTLTNGFIWDNGGGVYCESNAVLTNCVLNGNKASYYGVGGGGAYGGTLNNCTLAGNSAYYGGGGAEGSMLNNCTLRANSNCGAADSTLNYCVVFGNAGGGADSSTLNNCTVTGNSGLGAADSTLNNCELTGNSYYGSDSSTLNNCTIIGNSGWGAFSSTLNNCIVYFNSVPLGGNYDASCTLNYCCTLPLPTNGVGNISADPQLASASHLSAESPCIGAGCARYASGTDIDGDIWANPPSIGCDEYHAGAETGPLTVSLTATFTNVATGFSVGLAALIAGRDDLSLWDFGDGYVEVNRPYTSHMWTAPGDYYVALWAFNNSYPEGVKASVTVRVLNHLVQYVALGSTNPVAPYLSWATAATNIQDAVDVAAAGGTVFVTNGTYSAVAVNTPLTLQSVLGPDLTAINGGGAAQCLYLADNAVIVGFTLTNGWAYYYGGGVYCKSSSSVLSNCVLTGNSASYDGYGGGVYGGTLNYCTVTGNSGFGAGDSALNNCVLSNNTGGGALECTMINSVVSGNTGDGAFECMVNNCTVAGNSGWGAFDSTLDNCVLTGNTVGGTDFSTLNNCTITGNSGWGAFSSTLNNCIVYFNSDPLGGNSDPSCTLNYCCTLPLPTNGVGNISADPQLASASHLSAESPCIGAGSATYAVGTDIDGDAWSTPPSIGCDEYHAGAVTGSLTVSLTASYTNVVTGFPVAFTAFIQGRADLSLWDFGDGYVAVNQPYTSHAWTMPGDYWVALWTFNETYPEGVSATVTVHVDLGLHYVAATSGNPLAPYTSWATAATNIQDAVDVAGAGGTVFVTNGTYVAGGRPTSATGDGVTNRVAVAKPLAVRSVNGPGVTVIQGQLPGVTNGDIRCVYLANAAMLVGFTLTNGVADNGGGVYCESTNAVLTNCVLNGNWADGYYGQGGGAYGGTLNDCTLTGNSAWDGGGTQNSTLNNCTLTGNWGSGASGGMLNNCTLSGNFAAEDGVPGDGGGAYLCTLNNCTLTGNSAIVNAPWGGGSGGGAYGGTLNNCTLSGNSAVWGGGASGIVVIIPSFSGRGTDGVTLNNCTLTGNSSSDYGGGAYLCTLNNCTLTGNSALYGVGGGVSSCTLNDCTLTGNSTGAYGGGACDSTLNNCTLSGNSAPSGSGGGAEYSTLNNCTLTGNSASWEGGGAESCTLINSTLTGNECLDEVAGGAYGCTLNECTLTGNSGGGAYDCTLNNCVVSGNTSGGAYSDSYGPCTLNNCTITGNSGWGASSATLNNCVVYFNSDTNGGNYDPSCILNYCCTTPLPTNGVGNITSAPLFENYAGGNLRLQSNSLCINSGNNAYVVGSTDMDGNARIVGGTVDIGAYEYQTPLSMISYAWLQQYGLPINTNTDTADLDGTGMTVYQDWIAGLNPTNALSVLKMLAPSAKNSPLGLVVTWQSVSGITYFLQSSTNLAAQPAFITIQTNIVGQAGTTSCTDASATNAGPFFYRVGVGN